MKLSIYLSASGLEYIVGDTVGKKLLIKKAGKIALAEQGNELAMENILLQMKQKIGSLPKQVDLVIQSTEVINKIVEVPILSHAKLMPIVKSELIEFIEAGTEYVYDFSVISDLSITKTTGRILCVAMPKPLLLEYKELFQKVKINLSSMDITMSAQIKLMNQIHNQKSQTYILGILDGNQLKTSLYVYGEIVYNSISRVTERGNLGLISELNRVLSSFIQFNKSQKNDTDVEEIFLCGLQDLEKTFCQNLTTALGIDTKFLDAPDYVDSNAVPEYCLQEYIYTSGNLYRK